MKLDFDNPSDALSIRSYTTGEITIGDSVLTTPVVLTNDSILVDLLPPRFEDLERRHFQQLTELGTDIVILGSGRAQRFVDADIVDPLSHRGIGFESMDTGAACRCYNILIAENRSVLAALYMIER